MSRPKVLLVGHVTHDRVEGGFVPGGCVFYAGEVYRRLGADVHIAAVVGEDFLFDGALAGLSSTVTKRGRTTVFVNLYPDRGPRLQLLEAVGEPVTPDGILPEWLQADIVHLAPVIGEVDIAAWKRAVSGGLLAVNVQGWVRAAGPAVSEAEIAAAMGDEVARWARGNRVKHQPWQVSRDELAGVDVACLSHEDLEGQGDLLQRLCDAVPLVALTAGNRGCELIERSGRTRVGVYTTREVEPTGAGDTFAAAFLYQLAQGLPTAEAARFGAAAASIVIEDEGGNALARLDEAYARAEKIAAEP